MTMNFTRKLVLVGGLAICHLMATLFLATKSPCGETDRHLTASRSQVSERRDGPVRVDPLASPDDMDINHKLAKPTFPPGRPNLGPPDINNAGLPAMDHLSYKDHFKNKLAKDQYIYEVDVADPSYMLDPNLAPNNVFYVWCGRRWFEYQHYMSMLSVIKEVRPDNVIFFYDYAPVLDNWLYNTWFDEIREQYPFIIPTLVSSLDGACNGHGNISLDFVRNTLRTRGGLWVSEKTVMARYPIRFRNYTYVDAYNATDGSGFIAAKTGTTFNSTRSPTNTFKKFSCVSIPDFVSAKKKPICVSTNPVYFPKDIWELDNSFGRLIRRIFYGSPEMPKLKKSSDILIPNIAHVVWIGGGEMDYLFYLCILSLIYVAEVDMVYLHGDKPPSGPLWMFVKDEPKLRLIYRETPRCVFGTNVKVLSHVTDIYRVDFMMRYGGIYVDTDTIFARKLDDDIRSYDAVGSYDWTYWNHPFPDTINFGVAIGKRNAEYWRRFQDSMKWFLDQDWSWNGLRQPYRIKERHPDLVKIDPRLQVICYEFKCHPTWWPEYHNESIHHENSNSLEDWRQAAYSYHFTLPTPAELTSEENLLKGTSVFAEMGKNILLKAGRLKNESVKIPPRDAEINLNE